MCSVPWCRQPVTIHVWLRWRGGSIGRAQDSMTQGLNPAMSTSFVCEFFSQKCWFGKIEIHKCAINIIIVHVWSIPGRTMRRMTAPRLQAAPRCYSSSRKRETTPSFKDIDSSPTEIWHHYPAFRTYTHFLWSRTLAHQIDIQDPPLPRCSGEFLHSPASLGTLTKRFLLKLRWLPNKLIQHVHSWLLN